MNRLLKHILLLASLVCMNAGLVFGQKLPVNINTQVLPPYTTDYGSFTSSVGNKVRATVVLTDLQELSLDVRLRLVVAGGGIRLSTNPMYVPPVPISLQAGVPFIVDQSIIAPYFNPNNLIFEGIDRQQFILEGRFAEGMYTFSIEVLDYITGKVLSRGGSTIAWLKLNDEPTIISPRMASVIPVNGPQNILFQWQLNSPVNSGIPFTPAFKLFLYELTEDNVDPIYALQNGQTMLVYESEELYATTINYGPGNPTLTPGKVYMFRVQAYDPGGNNEFRNDGFSPNYYYYYGYPTGGDIEIKFPDKDYAFVKKDPQRFKFSSSDRLTDNQQFTYELKIVTIDNREDDAEDALAFGQPWHSEKTSPTQSRSDYTIEVKKPFDKKQWYAWQVKGYTGDQEIAASEIQKFVGPPLMDMFKAGIHSVYVTELESLDISNITGRGLVKIFQTDSDSTLTEVAFEGLKLRKIAGRYVLDQGEIVHEITDDLEFELSPRRKENKAAFFHPSQLRLDKEELSIKGYTEWTFPHPVKGEVSSIKTDENWVNFDYYAPFGTTFLPDNLTFDLLDPFGFSLVFSSTAEIQLFKNEYGLKLNGKINLPEKVKDVTGTPQSLTFQRIEQLFYVEQSGFQFSEPLAIIDKIDISITTNDYILDLSEETSPKKIESKDWKGLYFRKAQVDLAQDFDESSQLKFFRDFEFDYNQNISKKLQSWVDGQGLTFIWEHDFNGEPVGSFNTFPMNMEEAVIDVQGGALSTSQFTGGIMVPIMSTTKNYPVVIPITETGFGGGFFDGSLDTKFTFSEYGEENKAIVTVKQAAFKDNDHLKMAVEIDIPALGFSSPISIKDFRVYGDYFIGFEKRNGAINVNKQTGMYQGYEFELTKIGASLQGGDYLFSYKGNMKMDPEFSNPGGGSPEVSFHSTARVSSDIKEATFSSEVKSDILKPALAGDYNSKQIQMTFAFAFKNEFLDLRSELYRVKEDPEWGTRFKGEIEGNLIQPAKMDMGGLITFGSIDGTEYFYLDAYAADRNGQGVTIYPNVNLVGFEGRLYHKMNISGEDMNIDKKMDFGAALYGQFIDLSTLGQFFMIDAGIEFESSSSNLDMRISGDISLFNQVGRSPTVLANAIDSLKEEVVKEGIKQALRVIGPIEYQIDLGSGVVADFVLEESGGSIGMGSGGIKAGVYGKLDGGGAFGGINLTEGSVELNIEGDLNDRVSGTFETSDLGVRMDYDPNLRGGKFKLDYKDYGLEGILNQNASKGSIAFKYGTSVSVLADANYSSNEGEFVFEYDDIKLTSDVNLPAKRGTFDLNYNGNAFAISADGEKKIGDLAFAIDDIEVGMGFNQSEGSGTILFSNSDVSADAFASKAGKMNLSGTFDGNNVKLIGDKTEGGSIEVELGGEKASGWMKLDGQGGIELDAKGYYVKAEANQTTKAGAIVFVKDVFKIAAAGDPVAQTGSVDLAFDGNVVKGNFTVDAQDLRVETEGVIMTALNNADSTGLSMAKGAEYFAVGGDPAKSKGFVNFKTEDDEIFVSADQPNQSGSLTFSYDGIKADAAISKELKSVNFLADDIALGGLIKADTMGIDVRVEENSFLLGLKPDGNNSLVGAMPDVTFFAKANPSEKSGAFNLEIPDHNISTSFSPEAGNFNYSNAALKLGAALEVAGNGSMMFEKADIAANISGGKTAPLNKFDFKKGEQQVSMSLNKEGTAGDVAVTTSDARISASFSPESQMAVVGLGTDSIRMDHMGQGVGQLKMVYDDLNLSAKADPNNGTGQLDFEKGALKLGVKADMSDKAGTFNFAGAGVETYGAYALQNKSFYASQEGNYLRLAQAGKDLDAGVRFGDDSLAMVYQLLDQKGRVNMAYGSSFINGAVNLKEYQAALAMDLEGWDCKFDISVDKTDFKYKVAEGCAVDLDLNYSFDAEIPSFHIGLPDISLDLGTLPDVAFGLNLGDFDLSIRSDYSFGIQLPNFSLSMPSLPDAPSFGLGDLSGMTLNGIAFDINMPGLDISGFDINTGIGTIDFGDLAGFPLSLNFQLDGLSLSFNANLDLSFTATGWSISLPEGLDLNLDFNFDGSFQLASFEIPDFGGFSINPGQIQMLRFGDVMFDISVGSFAFNMDGLALDFNPELVGFSIPDVFDFNINPQGIDFGFGSFNAGFDLETGINLALPDFELALGADLGRLSFSGLDLGLIDGFSGLSLDFDGKLLSFSPELLDLQFGSLSLGLKPTMFAFKLDQDFLNFGFDGNIGAVFSGYDFNVDPSLGSLDFKAPDFNFGINTDGLFAGFDGINIDLSLDQTLTLSGLGSHSFSMSPISFDYGFDGINLGFELDKDISFSGFDLDLGLNPRANAFKIYSRPDFEA